jgi:bacterioferritin-associated ferredoxin
MAVRNNRTVCICNGVKKSEIVRILKKGAVNLEEVKKFTLASSSCGRCKPEVEAILEDYLQSKNSSLQRKIEF